MGSFGSDLVHRCSNRGGLFDSRYCGQHWRNSLFRKNASVAASATKSVLSTALNSFSGFLTSSQTTSQTNVQEYVPLPQAPGRRIHFGMCIIYFFLCGLSALGRAVLIEANQLAGVARRSSCALADLGLHELRGIPTSRRLWAMEVG